MAKVFRFEELAQGKVPREEDFPLVKKQIYKPLKRSPAIKWAGFYGSSVRDDFDFMSDVDVAVLIRIDRIYEAYAVLQRAQRYAMKLHVPLNVMPLDTQTALTRYHPWSPTFVRFLQYSADNGGWIKGVLEGVAPTIPLADELGNYLGKILNELDQLACEMGGEIGSGKTPADWAGEKRFRFLKKALNAPIDIARKMLIYHDALRGESRDDVLAAYEAFAPAHLIEQLTHLVKVSRWYKGVVKHQLACPNKTEYHEALLDLQVQLLRSSTFVRENITWFDLTRR